MTKYITENTKCDFLDINMGCPMPKLAKKLQAGGWHFSKMLIESMRYPQRLLKLYINQLLLKCVSAGINKFINAIEVAKASEDADVSVIAIHGLTREQMYTGKANWEIIRNVRKAVDTVMIGNGDVFCPKSAKAMIEHTGVDTIMVGCTSTW